MKTMKNTMTPTNLPTMFNCCTRTVRSAIPLKLVCLWAAVSFSLLTQAQSWNEIIKKAVGDVESFVPDRGANDRFGYSVAISGDYAIVGAYQEDQDASGATPLSDAGSAYIFKQTAGTWMLQQKIVASDRKVIDQFGSSVAISEDYAIVGARYEDEDTSGGATFNSAGSVYIFKQTAGVWSEQQKIVASDRAANDQFGSAIAISGDYVILGVYREDEDTSGGAYLSSAGSAYIFKQTEGVWSEQQKIVASDRAADDHFGRSVSISGDYAVVGANQEDDASGSGYLFAAGSAYIFKQTAGVWSQYQKITPSDREEADEFGYSVSISGDNIIIGAPFEDEDANRDNPLNVAGSAYIFRDSAGIWVEQQKIVSADRAEEDQFGISVCISGDYAIVGAYVEDEDANGGNTLSLSGSAYIYKQTAGTWSQQNKIVATDRNDNDQFARSVSISGNYAMAGSYLEDEDMNGANTLSDPGSAYIFKQAADTWGQQQKIVAETKISIPDRAADDQFGRSLAINGDYAVVGARYEDENANGLDSLADAGSAYIFKNTEGVWNQHQKLVPADRGAGDNFGHSVSISGDYIILGAPFEDENANGLDSFADAGSAYIFRDSAGIWVEQQKIVPTDRAAGDQFGYSVAISGDYVIVGARFQDEDAAGGNTLDSAGSAYTFMRSGTTWIQQDILVASDRAAYDEFGYSVSISGNYAIVGAYLQDEDDIGGTPLANAGAAYMFKQTAGAWSQIQKIVNADRAIGDNFGYSVAIDGLVAVVGAPFEDENAVGINLLADAGSAYVFIPYNGSWRQRPKIVAADRAVGDNFGHSVAVNGNMCLVGAINEAEDISGANTRAASGSVYAFQEVNSVWDQLSKTVSSDRAVGDQLGYAVAINGDYGLTGAYHEDEDSYGGNTLSSAGSIYFLGEVRCLTGTAPLALVRDSTYTASYSELELGYTNYCSQNGELLLSLAIDTSGAIVKASEVHVKTGVTNAFSYGTSGGVISNTDGYIGMDRLWDINATRGPTVGSSVGVRFYFSDAEYDSVVAVAARHVNSMAVPRPSSVISPPDLDFFVTSPSAPDFTYAHTALGVVLFDSTAPSVTKWAYGTRGSDHFAEFRVPFFTGGGGGAGAANMAFPVTLIDFHGEWLNASVANLSWKTATEINNSHFILERSTDGQHWEHCARIVSKAPNGKASQVLNYAQLDTDVPATHDYFYYRLVQHDFDGTIAIHDPIVLRREQGGVHNDLEAVLLYPNPFRGELTIVHAIDEEDVQIKIADALGRVVYTVDRVAPHQTIALNHLPTGLYYATISSPIARRVHRIIKQ